MFKLRTSPILFLFVIFLSIFSLYKIGRFFVFKSQTRTTNIILERPSIGFSAPDFIIEDIYGMQAPLSTFYAQKPILLIFWATWCPFCAEELSGLNSFYKKHQGDIYVIAVTGGEPKETVKDYAKENNVSFLLALDFQKSAWSDYLVLGTPHHFLIDKGGNILNIQAGLLSFDQLEFFARDILKSSL